MYVQYGGQYSEVPLSPISCVQESVNLIRTMLELFGLDVWDVSCVG